ncbi:MAG: DNA gyrase inhibitor YacG [Planctomycetes bacterium]|nr:DNA gyrase inhibitor YacG [Planctomycetota bacterium]
MTESNTVTLICPTCDGAFDARISVAMPFCSHRCREIDLGRWLEEGHGLPIEPPEGAEDGASDW